MRSATARPAVRGLTSAPAASHAPDGKVWLSGHVRDEQGQPVEGARVRVLDNSPSEMVGAQVAQRNERDDLLAEVTTDALGAFDAAVVSGPVNVEVEATGFVPAQLEVKDPAREAAEVTLMRTCALLGRVELAATGAPVAGARVLAHLTGPSDLEEVPAVTTDAQGRFRIDGLAPGRYKPWASSPGLLGQAAESVSLRAGTDSEPVVIRMLAGHRVRGEIRKKRADQPCEKGYVELRAGGLEMPFLRAPAGPDGKIVLESVPAGTYSVHVGCSGSVMQASEPLHVARDLDGVSFDFELDALLHDPREKGGYAHVRGSVVDISGQPVTNVSFSFLCNPVESVGEVDESGRFRARVKLGSCEVKVQWGAEALPVLEPRSPLQISPDSIREPLRVVVDTSEFAFLAGTVRQQGTAVAGATVVAVCGANEQNSAFEGETDRTGQFRVRVRRAGPCWLRAWVGEQDSMEAGPVEPNGSLALELRAPGGLRGIVARPDGAPASLFSVELTSLLHGVQVRTRRSETFFGSDGRWRLEGIGPGDYSLSAEFGDESVTRDVHVEPGSQGELKLTLEKERSGTEDEAEQASP
jgi:hypothetical protein